MQPVTRRGAAISAWLAVIGCVAIGGACGSQRSQNGSSGEALVDQLDDAEVSEGDCTTIFKRTANYGVSERVEISAVSGSTLTLTTPLHWTFTTAQKAG